MNIDPFVFYLVLGVALISVELLVLGLSVFWLLFIGIGALVAAAFGFFVTEPTWLMTTTVFLVSSVLVCVGLYRPLKTWQDKPSILPGHDAIGQHVEIVSWDEGKQMGQVMWSGARWDAELAPDTGARLHLGDDAQIIALTGIKLMIANVK